MQLGRNTNEKRGKKKNNKRNRDKLIGEIVTPNQPRRAVTANKTSTETTSLSAATSIDIDDADADSNSDDDVGTVATGTVATVSTSSPGDQLIHRSIELLESSDDGNESFD